MLVFLHVACSLKIKFFSFFILCLKCFRHWKQIDPKSSMYHSFTVIAASGLALFDTECKNHAIQESSYLCVRDS